MEQQTKQNNNILIGAFIVIGGIVLLGLVGYVVYSVVQDSVEEVSNTNSGSAVKNSKTNTNSAVWDTANENANANTNADSEEEQQTYSYVTEYHAFMFELPESWIVDESSAHNVERQGLLTTYDPEDPPATAYFTMSFYNNAGTLSEWIYEHKQELVRSHEDIIESESDYSDTQRQVVMGEMKGIFKHAYCYVQGDGVVYESYFSSELKNWGQYEDIFNNTCLSFEVTDKLADTSDWLMYENEEWGFSLKHPDIFNSFNESENYLGEKYIIMSTNETESNFENTSGEKSDAIIIYPSVTTEFLDHLGYINGNLSEEYFNSSEAEENVVTEFLKIINIDSRVGYQVKNIELGETIFTIIENSDGSLFVVRWENEYYKPYYSAILESITYL